MAVTVRNPQRSRADLNGTRGEPKPSLEETVRNTQRSRVDLNGTRGEHVKEGQAWKEPVRNTQRSRGQLKAGQLIPTKLKGEFYFKAKLPNCNLPQEMDWAS